MNAIKLLVQANCGITFLYEAAAKKEILNGSLRESGLRNSTFP
jgi:hypothetical protein